MTQLNQPVSILDQSDDQLIENNILLIKEVIPRSVLWLTAAGVISIWLGCIGLFITATMWAALVLLFCGISFCFAGAYVAFFRILFMLHRQQLEIRILVDTLPAQAATLFTKHMNIPGRVPPPSQQQ